MYISENEVLLNMEISLPRLLSISLCLAITVELPAQCSFPLRIVTSKDFCLGSSLTLSSDHAFHKIVWYKDGQPFDSAFAAQSIDNQGVIVATQVSHNTICLDTARNIYAWDADIYAIRKFSPGSTTGTIVAGDNGRGLASDQLYDVITACVDDQGNLYLLNTYDLSYNDRLLEWRQGANEGATLLVTNTIFPYSVGPHSLYRDCAGNFYFSDCVNRKVMEWTPGADSPVTIAMFPPLIGNQTALNIGVEKDAAGNLFVSDAGQDAVWRFSPGDPNGVFVAGTNSSTSYGPNYLSDFWVDADDTLYLLQPLLNKVGRWAPGATDGATYLNINTAMGVSTGSMSRDIRGNFYFSQGSGNIVEYQLTTAIDTTLTPTQTGQYYAVATDVLGYTQTSDIVYINTPQAGTPSIQISATATSTPVCTPITFTATTTNTGPDPHYQWDVSGVHTGADSPAYSYNLFADGDQVYCMLTAPAGCTGQLVTDTSNIITLRIDPQGSATVAITASDTAICQGSAVVFDATVTNGSTQPVFQWQVNGGLITGDDTAAYHTDSLQNGDVITCIIASDNVCGLAKSNSIPIHITAPPVIGPNPAVSIRYGQSVTLEPNVTGNITSWLWTPSTGLSDNTIEDPVASPLATTDYKFKITTSGCGADSGNILVNVYTPLSIPNAFTPNGDGHNDIFYVLGGPTGSQVEELAIFDRWGQIVFQSHDAAPGDPSRGWNGYRHGQPAQPDTYVYQIVMRFSDGSRQIYKGTVLLIR